LGFQRDKTGKVRPFVGLTHTPAPGVKLMRA